MKNSDRLNSESDQQSTTDRDEHELRADQDEIGRMQLNQVCWLG